MPVSRDCKGHLCFSNCFYEHVTVNDAYRLKQCEL